MKESIVPLPPECDPWCRYRRCLAPGENKGTFSQGRGYTSYSQEFRPVCITRHVHGCPQAQHVQTAEQLVLRPLPDLRALLEQRKREVAAAKYNPKARLVVKNLIADIERAITYLMAYQHSSGGL